MPAAAGSNSNAPKPATLPRFDVIAPPSDPALHAKHQSLADLLQPSYWQQLNPGLHVGDACFIRSCKPLKPAKDRLKDLSTEINTAGVAQVEPEELPWKLDLDAMADAVVNLVRAGWPPSMLMVYDEVWVLIQQASAVMQAATGGNLCNMDILTWLVDPNRGDAGFCPHRDRQPDDTPATFRPDGSAMYATMWVPLTHATPDNSCLYVIPRFADPGYFEGDPEDEGAPDPMTAALPDKEAYQHIRALPARPGSALLFTHRTIHWGSKGRPGYPTPRISLSWGCADDAYEPAYFSREHLPCPPLELRLGLVGAQMIIYHERFPAPPRQLRLYYEAFTSQSAKFDPTYRAKVVREFVDASKAATATAALTAGGAAANGGPAGKVRDSKAAAAENGAAAGDSSSQKKKGKKQKQAAASEQTAAKTEPPQQQQASSKKRSKEQQAAVAVAGGAGRAGANAPQPSAASTKKSKRQKQQLDVVASAVAAAGAAKPPAAAADPDSEDDGVAIDWEQLAAQAKAHNSKAKSSKAAGSSKGSGAAAAAAAAGSEDAAAGLGCVSDDEDDVLDLALDAMLDGGGDDFADDYEDD